MENLVNVTIKGKINEYPTGTSIFNISQDYNEEYKNDIILAIVDNKLKELHKRVKKDCEIEFITTISKDGRKTYERGLIIVMLKAIYNVLGKEIARHVSIEYSVSNGVYCSLYTMEGLTADDVKNIKIEMKSIIEKDLPIEKKTIGTDEALELFNEYGMYDKAKLFKYRRVSKTNIYNLDGFEDYFYGYMPISTGVLKYFDLLYYEGGIMLVLPSKKILRKLMNIKLSQSFSIHYKNQTNGRNLLQLIQLEN